MSGGQGSIGGSRSGRNRRRCGVAPSPYAERERHRSGPRPTSGGSHRPAPGQTLQRPATLIIVLATAMTANSHGNDLQSPQRTAPVLIKSGCQSARCQLSATMTVPTPLSSWRLRCHARRLRRSREQRASARSRRSDSAQAVFSINATHPGDGPHSCGNVRLRRRAEAISSAVRRRRQPGCPGA